MSTARTKARSAPGVGSAVLDGWGVPAVTGAIALAAALATAFDLIPASVGLAVTILGVLGLGAERGLGAAATAPRPRRAVVLLVGVVWIAVCYLPFHALLFPGAPLHEPLHIHGTATGLPVTIPTGGRTAVDLTLEAELPHLPGGGAAAPVHYAVTLADATGAEQVVGGVFEESLRTRRLGRRGTAQVLHTHHAERHRVSNPGGGDLVVTGVTLDPPTGASVTVTAYAHRLPSTAVLVVLGVALLGAVIALDTRLVPGSSGTLLLATGVVLGTALALWTSDTVHPTVSNLIGSIIFGGPVGLALGALLWTIARRILVHDRA
jgi:hypothetical protein